ncbi:MAG: TIGR02300 family protein [Rhodobacteraceae bacterium]|nr:TIGR02300 family protein [Paracoccaceae bacterium]
MPRQEWGVKRTCPTTGKRFYDLGRSPVVSPYTGEVVDIDGARRKVAPAEAKPIAKAKPEAVADDDDLETDDDLIEDDAVDIEDDLLEDEDDDSVSLDDIADVSSDDD